MLGKRIQLRNGIVAIQQVMLRKNSIAVMLFYDINHPPKDSLIVCGGTIKDKGWHSNTDFVTNLVGGGLSLLAVLSFSPLISIL